MSSSSHCWETVGIVAGEPVTRRACMTAALDATDAGRPGAARLYDGQAIISLA